MSLPSGLQNPALRNSNRPVCLQKRTALLHVHVLPDGLLWNLLDNQRIYKNPSSKLKPSSNIWFSWNAYVRFRLTYVTWGLQFSLCLEDISRVALGKYILALARAICQADAEGLSSQTKFYSLLEKMFNLYMDYGISWADSAGLSLAEAGIMNEPEVAESAIYRYMGCRLLVQHGN